MERNLEIESMIISAIAAVAQTNANLLFSVIHNDDEEENAHYKNILLDNIKEYLIDHYGLDNNDFDDNDILDILFNNEDEFTVFILNTF